MHWAWGSWSSLYVCAGKLWTLISLLGCMHLIPSTAGPAPGSRGDHGALLRTKLLMSPLLCWYCAFPTKWAYAGPLHQLKDSACSIWMLANFQWCGNMPSDSTPHLCSSQDWEPTKLTWLPLLQIKVHWPLVIRSLHFSRFLPLIQSNKHWICNLHKN